MRRFRGFGGSPGSDRLHTLIPRETERFKALYTKRVCVERGFGRLKHEWALLPLRVRRFERVRHRSAILVDHQFVVEQRVYGLGAFGRAIPFDGAAFADAIREMIQQPLGFDRACEADQRQPALALGMHDSH